MVLRSVVGAVAAVAVIGALAAVVPERKAGLVPVVAKEPPFGAVPKNVTSSGSLDSAVATASERQALLKLAAYSDPKTRAIPAVADEGTRGGATPEAAAHLALTPAPLADVPQAQNAPPVASLSPSTVASPQDPTPQAPAPPPAQVATRSPATAAELAKPKPGLVNINKASVAELDHLPGGGRIGYAIARRRPYHSVDDLVRKRVLRDSAFARIKSAITVE